VIGINWGKGYARKRDWQSCLTSRALVCLVAEEEGFDFVEYEGRHLLACVGLLYSKR
jgi:hypothetical protein